MQSPFPHPSHPLVFLLLIFFLLGVAKIIASQPSFEPYANREAAPHFWGRMFLPTCWFSCSAERSFCPCPFSLHFPALAKKLLALLFAQNWTVQFLLPLTKIYLITLSRWVSLAWWILVADSSLSIPHCKKSLTIFPSPAGMSLTKLYLDGNN